MKRESQRLLKLPFESSWPWKIQYGCSELPVTLDSVTLVVDASEGSFFTSLRTLVAESE